MNKSDYMTADKAKLSTECWTDFWKRVGDGEVQLRDQVKLAQTAMDLRPCEYPKRDRLFFEIGFQYALICLEQGVITQLGGAN